MGPCHEVAGRTPRTAKAWNPHHACVISTQNVAASHMKRSRHRNRIEGERQLLTRWAAPTTGIPMTHIAVDDGEQRMSGMTCGTTSPPQRNPAVRLGPFRTCMRVSIVPWSHPARLPRVTISPLRHPSGCFRIIRQAVFVHFHGPVLQPCDTISPPRQNPVAHLHRGVTFGQGCTAPWRGPARQPNDTISPLQHSSATHLHRGGTFGQGCIAHRHSPARRPCGTT